MIEPSPLPRPTDGPAPIRLYPDLPTRAGFDSDHPLARGLVGQEGPAISHLGDMAALLSQPVSAPVVIDADTTGPWLLAMLAALAGDWPGGRDALRGALRNDPIAICRGPATPPWSSAAALDLAADTLSWSSRALPKLRGARLHVAAPVDGDVLPPLVAALQSGLALLAATARRERPQHLRAAARGVEFLMPGNGPGDRAAGATLSRLWRALLLERHGPDFAPSDAPVIYPAEAAGPGFADAPAHDMLRAALQNWEAGDGAAAVLPSAMPMPARPLSPPDPERDAALALWRRERDGNAVQKSLLALREAAKRGINVMGPSVACAKAGVTTGEWAATLSGALPASPPPAPAPQDGKTAICAPLLSATRGLSRPLTLLLIRPGLDASPWSDHPLLHAAQLCGVVLRDCGARRTPLEITSTAYRDKPHAMIFGLSNAQSIEMAGEMVQALQKAGFGAIPMLGLVAFNADPSAIEELSGIMTLRKPWKITPNEFLEELAQSII